MSFTAASHQGAIDMLWLHFSQVIYHALTSCHLLVTHGTTFTANQAAEKQTSFYT